MSTKNTRYSLRLRPKGDDNNDGGDNNNKKVKDEVAASRTALVRFVVGNCQYNTVCDLILD